LIFKFCDRNITSLYYWDFLTSRYNAIKKAPKKHQKGIHALSKSIASKKNLAFLEKSFAKKSLAKGDRIAICRFMFIYSRGL